MSSLGFFIFSDFTTDRDSENIMKFWWLLSVIRFWAKSIEEYLLEFSQY